LHLTGEFLPVLFPSAAGGIFYEEKHGD